MDYPWFLVLFMGTNCLVFVSMHCVILARTNEAIIEVN